MKQKISLLLILLICISCAGCGSPKSEFSAVKEKSESILKGQPKNIDITDNDTTICKNDNFELLLTKTGLKMLSASESENIWKTGVDNEVFADFDTSTDVWKAYMTSIISITYAKKDDMSGALYKEYSGDIKNLVSIEKYNNGLYFKYDFKKSGIKVNVEVALDNDGISIRIPGNEISESESYQLHLIEVMPFLSAASNKEEGYIFYPDGCGAITYFDKVADKSKYAKQLVLDVYGSMETETVFSDDNNPISRLPVYGIKKNNSGVLAAVVQGDSDVQINVNPAIEISKVKLNTASFSLIYRQKYTLSLSRLTSSKDKEKTGVLLSDNLLDYDRTVKFFLLNETNSNYSGMANAYRNYLIENNILKSKIQDDAAKLYLKFFMGIKENGSGKFINTTEYSDVKNILDEYLSEDIKNITAILRGWQQGGWNESLSSLSPEKKLGGEKDFNALYDYISENNKNLNMLLETEDIYLHKKQEFFIKGKNAVTDGANAPIMDKLNFVYLLNMDALQKKQASLDNFLNKYSKAAILKNGAGDLIYSDRNNSSENERYEINQFFESGLKKLNDNAAVSSGNLYALPYVNDVIDVQQSTSDSLIEDEKIPWYQMVIHGSLQYTTETGNSSSDFNIQKLRWIEYGAVPYFEITSKNPEILRDTNYSQLFTSENSHWKNQIIDIYNEFSKEIFELSDYYIVSHKKTGDVVTVKYSNGTTVIINYGIETLSAENYWVPPQGYIVIRG